MDPFTFDAVDFGPDIDAGDLDATVLRKKLDTFGDYRGPGTYCFDVTAGVNEAIANPKTWSREGSQHWFQISLSGSVPTDNNGESDRLRFGTFEAGLPACLQYLTK